MAGVHVAEVPGLEGRVADEEPWANRAPPGRRDVGYTPQGCVSMHMGSCILFVYLNSHVFK